MTEEQDILNQRQIDIDDDYELTRDTYRMLLEIGKKALPKLSAVCDDTEHPRSFEVFFKGLKDTADVADKLLELQRKKQVVDSESAMDLMRITENDKQPLLEARVVKDSFTGSVAEMQRRLSEKKKEEDENV